MNIICPYAYEHYIPIIYLYNNITITITYNYKNIICHIMIIMNELLILLLLAAYLNID